MTRTLAIAAALTLAGCATMDTAAVETGPIMAQQEIWADALVANDMATVDALMHPDFRLVRAYGDGAPIDKASYLGMEGMSADSAEITSAEVVDVNGNVAVMRLTMSLDWQQEGYGPLPPHFKMTDTWMENEDGVWQILSRVSLLDDSPPTATGN